MRRGLGLEPLAAGAVVGITTPPDLYLMGTVPEFEYPRSDLLPQTRFVGPFIDRAAPPAAAPPSWWPDLDRYRRVVHVTEGTVNYAAQRLIPPTIEAFADDPGTLVVATAPDAGPRSRALPANVRVEPFIPHALLPPDADVMITNGGYGGVQAALTHGVPLVIAGATEEKPDVAAHVQHAGVGVNLRAGRPRPGQLRDAVRRALDPRLRARVQAMRDRYAGHNAPAEAADHIEALQGDRARPSRTGG